MPTFNNDLPDAISGKATPSEAVVGRLSDDATVDTFVSVLADAGVDDSRIHVLRGPEGIEVLENLGGPLGRFFGPDRNEPVEFLRDVATLVAVFGVAGHDQDHVATAVADAGATRTHYFGKWTYS